MPHIVEDRVLETTSSIGVGDIALAAAVTGFRRFGAVCAVGDTVPYFIEAVDAVGLPSGDYEYGIGTYSAANTLTRTTVKGSSNGGAAVNFAAGSKNVGIALTSAELISRTAARGHLGGLTLSTAGGSGTFSVAAGEATDKDNSRVMVLASAMSKTTAAWVAGSASGGLDSGAIANNTWYHVHLIERTDQSARDVLVSLSASAPTMPAGYSYSRRIGSMRTNGAGQWIKFVQDGDYFQWDAPVSDLSTSSTGTAAATRNLTTPNGVSVRAVLNVGLNGGTGGEGVLLSDLTVTDTAPNSSNATFVCPPTHNASIQATVRTNTSGQIRTRCIVGSASESLRLTTVGWYDTRGRDA